jgi:hypothetical protein
MTEKIIALVQRDVHKAEKALEQAKKRPSVPKEELEHLEELVVLRKAILQKCEVK